MLVAAGLEKIIIDTVKTVPDVTVVKTYFVVTPPEQYAYADGR